MSTLYIHAVNSEFKSRDDGADYDTPEDALAVGVRSAVAIAADEIERGKSASAVEVCVRTEDGTPMLRSVIALSVMSLML